MNKRLLSLFGLIGLSALLFWSGTVFAQARGTAPGWQSGWMMGQSADAGTGTMNGSMMNGRAGHNIMMNGRAGHGMMNGGAGCGMMNGGAGPGMMNGSAGHGTMNGGMWGGGSGLTAVDPISVEAAEAAVTDYLAAQDNDSLVLGEIMIFDNHAYAQVLDESTGQGAFELLIDPVSGNVFPEPGPNMMWNTTYGMMGGGMMGNFGAAVDGTNTVTAEAAVSLAQVYLDANLPGKTADEHADIFPGYFTLHVLEDGEVVGMLSVHAATGQVFLHHWHGEFVEMADFGHD